MQSFCLLFFQILQSIATKETEAYGLAGAVAEEVLSAIRIVAAYAGEAKEVMRYEENLKTARSVGIMKGLVSGLGQGLVWIIAFGVIGLAFWYGGELVRDEDIMYTAGIVLQVLLIYMYNYRVLQIIQTHSLYFTSSLFRSNSPCLRECETWVGQSVLSRQFPPPEALLSASSGLSMP